MKIRRNHAAAALALLCVAMPAAGAAPDRIELDRLIAKAEAMDNNADPTGYLAVTQAALAEARRLYPRSSPEVAAREVSVALGYASISKFAEAQALVEPAIALLSKAGPVWRVAHLEGLNTLGYIYVLKGDHAGALAVFEREIAGRRAIDPASEKVATATSNLAAVNWEMGRADEALRLNAEAIAIAERLAKPPSDLVIWYANRTTYLFAGGRTDDAIATARAGLAWGDRNLPPDHPSMANLYANLGAMLNRQGRPVDAAPMIRRAFELVEKTSGKPTQNSATMRVIFAQALIEQRRYAEAEAFLAVAAPIIEGELGADSDRALLARESRAIALMRLGRLADARAIQTQVLAARDARMLPVHRDRMNGRVNLARIALADNDLTGARTALEQAVALREKAVPANHPDLLAERAMLLMVRGRIDRALAPKLAPEARQILAALVENAGFETGNVATNRDRAAFGYVAEVLIAAGDVAGAFTAQQYAARTTVDDAVAAAGAQRAAAADPALAARLDARRKLAVERGQVFAGLQAQLQRPDPAFRLDTAAARIADLDARLRRSDADAGAAAASGRFQARALADAQAALGEGDVFAMVTELGSERVAVTLLTRTRSAQYLANVDGRVLRDRVARLRASLDRSGAAPVGGFARADAAALYAELFTKAGARLLSGRQRLLVSANAAFAALPFAVLMPARDTFLIDRLAVERLPGAPRAAIADRAAASDRLIGIGNAAGGSGAGGKVALRSGADARVLADLPALTEAAAELADLARAVGAARPVILTGGDATEARFRATAVAPGAVVAFATHGLVSGELEGLREPALVLTPADADDGLLTASEISALTIPADWVVLSACNTAAGAGPDAPGLSGLAQAFILAGSERILATHWRVRDDVARAISVGTLTAAGRGLPPAAALREAVLKVKRGSVAGGADPSAWAVFELIGQ